MFEIKFNDTTVSLENKTIEGSTSSGWTPTFVEVSLGDVEVKAGENTITVTALENGGTNLDYFKLTPKA